MGNRSRVHVPVHQPLSLQSRRALSQEAIARLGMDIPVMCPALPQELDHLSSAAKTAQLRCTAENLCLIALMLRWLRAEYINVSKLLNTKALILFTPVPAWAMPSVRLRGNPRIAGAYSCRQAEPLVTLQILKFCYFKMSSKSNTAT